MASQAPAEDAMWTPCAGLPARASRSVSAASRVKRHAWSRRPTSAATMAWIGADSDVSCEVRARSEEHLSELLSLMLISYALLCLLKKHCFSTTCHTANFVSHLLPYNTTSYA